MAIGARITSSNLSGKTATVTFVPYTGSTSGTSVNIGEVTIPFNNITSHPYGVYSIYLPEYDYTYTLTIDEPVTDQETFVFVSKRVDSDNYGIITMNFTDFNAEIIDFGVDSTVYYINNIYPLTNSGYMYEFQGRDDSDYRYVVFTDATNQIIDTYTGITYSRNMDALDGTWVLYEDEVNGVMKYSNGTNVYSYTWDANYQNVGAEWQYDATTSDGSFVLKKEDVDLLNNVVSGVTYTLMKNDGTQDVIFSLESGYTSTFFLSPAYDFMLNLTKDTTTNYYAEFDIRQTDGTIIGDSHLLGGLYNSYNINFYGTNKAVLVFWDNNNSSTDYAIYHYNYDTSTLVEDTHAMTNYPSFDISANTFFWPDDNVSENLVLTFYNTQNWSNRGVEVGYCDLVYMMSGQTGFTTYNLIDTGSFDKTIDPYGMTSNPGWFTITSGNNPGGYVEFLTITPESGVTINSTDVLISDYNGSNWNALGERYVYSIDYSGYTLYSIYLVDSNGILIDSLTGNTALSFNTIADVAYINTNNDSTYYINNSTTGFTDTGGYYGSSSSTNGYDTGTYLDPSVIFVYNTDTKTGKMITADSISSLFELAPAVDWDIRIGVDKLLYTYLDLDTGTVKMLLFDFNGVLLNDYDTTQTSWNNTHCAKNRFVVVCENSGNYTAYMINESAVLSQTVTNLDSNYSINDYIWWD